MLIDLGEKELQSILDELRKAEVICDYCNEKYDFDKQDLEKILARID